MNIGEGHYQNSAEIKLFIAEKPEDISLQDFHIWGRGGEGEVEGRIMLQ